MWQKKKIYVQQMGLIHSPIAQKQLGAKTDNYEHADLSDLVSISVNT